MSSYVISFNKLKKTFFENFLKVSHGPRNFAGARGTAHRGKRYVVRVGKKTLKHDLSTKTEMPY